MRDHVDVHGDVLSLIILRHAVSVVVRIWVVMLARVIWILIREVIGSIGIGVEIWLRDEMILMSRWIDTASITPITVSMV